MFQGRFHSVLIDNDGAWLLVASEYLHLNPVRVAGMGLGKRENLAESRGLREPSAEEVKGRLEKLLRFKWSSYPAYAGYAGKAKWLRTETILARIGGKQRYRKAVQEHITRGADPDAFDCLRGRVAIGTAAFVERAKNLVGSVTKEQPDRKFVRHLIDYDRVVEIVEQEKGEKWEFFNGRYGDWGRDLVLYLARKRCGMTFAEIGRRAGGMDYKVAEKAVYRFGEKIQKNRKLRSIVKRCLAQMSDVGT